MVLKKKAAAGFGAAMATVFVSPQLQADLVDFQFITNNVASAGGTAGLNQGDLAGDGIGENFAFGFYNSTFSSTGPGVNGDANISFLVGVESGDSVTAGAAFSDIVSFGTGVTGEQFVAFTSGSGIGWFRVDFGSGTDSDTTFLNGSFHAVSDGKAIIVGQSASVPEPGALGGLALLALGAAGRRRRKN